MVDDRLDRDSGRHRRGKAALPLVELSPFLASLLVSRVRALCATRRRHLHAQHFLRTLFIALDPEAVERPLLRQSEAPEGALESSPHVLELRTEHCLADQRHSAEHIADRQVVAPPAVAAAEPALEVERPDVVRDVRHHGRLDHSAAVADAAPAA